MTDPAKGVAAMLAACTIWGLSPLYYKLLVHVPPIEILAHRTLWSFVFFAVVLRMQGRIRILFQSLVSRSTGVWIVLAAFLISFNWFVFITSIQIEKAVEAALGYYIFPLISVLLGALVLGERLGGRVQMAAVALAMGAVAILTIGLGVAPWIALLISFSFGLYGLVKKRLFIGPVVSVTAEVLCLTPIALVLLVGIHTGPDGGAFGATWPDTVLLAVSGPLTATPLILFSYAARRVSLATLGLVQYLNPSLQFLVATLIFLEPFTGWHAVAFALIWTALALYTASGWHQDRAARRAASRF